MKAVLVLVLAVLVPAAAARAQEGVIVIDFDRAEPDEELARHLGSATREAAAQMPGWDVSPRAPSLAEAMAAAACQTLDAACLGRIALAHEAERVIYARVVPAPAPPAPAAAPAAPAAAEPAPAAAPAAPAAAQPAQATPPTPPAGPATPPATPPSPPPQREIEIHVYRASWGAEEIALHDRVPARARSPAEVAARVRSWVERLAGRPLTGRIVVHAATSDAEVLIDGQTVLSVQDHAVVTSDVAAGARTVEVRIPGHYTMRRRVVVEPGQEVVVEAETDQDGAAANLDEDGSPAGIDALSGDRFDYLAWSLTIGGGVAILAGLVTTLRIGSIDDEPDFVAYRQTVPAGHDVCVDAANGETHGGPSAVANHVDDLCGEASLLETLQWILYAGGLAAAGAGVFLLLTPDDPDPADRRRPGEDEPESAPETTGVSWQPIVGTDRAELRATVRF